jgi:hypothetical protein
MTSNKTLWIVAGAAIGGVLGILAWQQRRSEPVTTGYDFDAVDLANDDSFPASDPPSSSGAHA